MLLSPAGPFFVGNDGPSLPQQSAGYAVVGRSIGGEASEAEQCAEALQRRVAEAAARSIEAAHDVLADALAQSEARELAHRKRADAAEASLVNANRRAEVHAHGSEVEHKHKSTF